jgi:rod shape determining protein RodA
MVPQTWRNFDFWLFGSVLLLSIFGVVMIRSSIAGNIELAEHPTRQMIYLGIAVLVILVAAFIDYHYWASLTRFMYIFTVLALLVIYVYGQARFGSARWLDTGLFLIQPSEIGKIVILLVLADYFERTKEMTRDLRWIGTSLALTLGIVVWIVLQPNLSTSIVIMVLWFSMLWINGLPMKYLVFMIIIGLVLGIAAFPFLQDYQQARIITFFFPDPNARYGDTYNVDQALISIGSGGLFGQGYGQGTQVQLRFLKVRHTDFIFSAMAEEFGLVGTVIVLLLTVFILVRCLRAARLAPDIFGASIAYGFTILIFFQMAVNIGVNLNLVPVTGLTYPFISYGGSSLVSLALGIGLVESIISRRKTIEF